MKKARGDRSAAAALYRGLLTPGPESKWVAAVEPAYVLELARLLRSIGDRVTFSVKDSWGQQGTEVVAFDVSR